MEKNKYHILVVDDDDKIKELIKQFLVEKGLIVSTASNADEAKKKVDFLLNQRISKLTLTTYLII